MGSPLIACSSDGKSESGGGSGAGGSGGTAGGGGTGGSGGSGGSGAPLLESNLANLGPLGEPDANGVRLPEGFTSRIIATTGETVAGTNYEWHGAPDGGATYPTPDGGWIYVSNSEVLVGGGVGAIAFNASGEIVDAYRILDDTTINCAGGPTPWGTWLSCEEVDRGAVFECDPTGQTDAIERPALGIFKHEAVAYDTDNHHLFLTEDHQNGRFYRFVPDAMSPEGFADLGAGTLEVAQVMEDNSVVWLPVPDPSSMTTLARDQVPESTAFDGGEGIWFQNGMIYFSTKGDNTIWAYDVNASTIRVLYDAAVATDPILTGVDNITMTCCGDVLVAEDGGDMQVVAILANGDLKPLLQIDGHDESEVTGPAFDPSGTRLYFSSQRGTTGALFSGGITFEVTGPFHLPLS